MLVLAGGFASLDAVERLVFVAISAALSETDDRRWLEEELGRIFNEVRRLRGRPCARCGSVGC